MANKDRFQIVETQGNGLSNHKCTILLDTVTGVQYLFVQGGYAGGLCPLVNKDGGPVTWDT